MKPHSDPLCPCGSGLALPDCCGRYLDGGESAPTAEALMRSRYSAWCLQRNDYLLDSWHPSTRPARLTPDSANPVHWIGLKILNTLSGGSQDDAGTVEFVARGKVNGRAQRLHEISRFVREQGRWYYVDGDVS